jgi:periplasmic divalent cation tolerance protein
VADEDGPIVLMVTAGGRDDAERLGEALVVEHLAGSCSVVPTVHSFYFADGLLQREHEALLLVRTVASKRGQVMRYLEERNAGERPEILEMQVAKPGANR